MKSALRQGESIVKEGVGNLQKGIEAVGGRLFLTNQRVVFEAHKFNVQGGITEIPLAEVVSASTCWTLLLGIIPLVPNSISVNTRSGKEYRFVVMGREEWVSAFNKTKVSR